MTKNRILYYFFCTAIFIFLAFLIQIGDFDFKNIFLSFFPYFMGINIIYCYLNDRDISFGWVTVKKDDSKIERTVYFIVGFVLIVISIYAMENRWQ